MAHRATILGVLFLVCLGLPNIHAVLQTRPQSVTAPPREQAEIDRSKTPTEAELLRVQLSTIKDYEGQLLSTVHWTLTAVVAMVVLVAGFGWYSNSRVYEREKESLRQYCESLIQAQTLGMDKQLQQRLAGLETANQEFRNDSEEVISKRFANLSGEVDTLVKQASASSIAHMSGLEAGLKRLRCDFLDYLAEAKERDGSKQSAVTTNIAFLSAAKEIGNSYAIMRAMQGIVRLLKDGQTLFDSDLPQLLRLLEGLPAECAFDAKNLRDQMERIRKSSQ